MKRLFIIVILAVAAGLFIRANVFETIYVASGSMEPTLEIGEKYVSEKITYALRNPRKGEVVVFVSPVDGSKELIKRIIAEPGDKIEIRSKEVFLNNERLNEPYTRYTRWGELLKGDNLGPFIVPSGKFFVMGDNRDESGDSRDWVDPATEERIYFVDSKSIKGRLVLK